MSFRPRLSAVLLTVNLAVIALPLGSIFFFRIYENQLIQETERELISQAAVIAAAYEALLKGPAPDRPALTANAQVPEASGQGARSYLEQSRGLDSVPRTDQLIRTVPPTRWSPINPQLDLARVEKRPKRPDGRTPSQPSTAAAVSAGKTLSPILDRAQKTNLVGVRVLDENGTTVGGTAEVGLNFAHVDEVREALQGRYASALRYREIENAPSELSSISRGTGVRVFVALPITDGREVLGAVYLSRTPKSILRHLYENRDKAILALMTVLFLAVSLAWLTSRTISRPVAELLTRTRRVARGESDRIEPLERPGTREMAELADGISTMAKALSDRAAYIRTLASHVSHEFKTPLTSIEGAAELLRDHHDGMTADERQKFLETISAGGQRLRALLDRLLDLARAENAPRTEDLIDLAQAVTRASAGRSALDVDNAVPETLRGRISEDALGIVLGNLLENAAQHGATRVRIAGQSGGEAVHLQVEDDGGGITPANREKIFEHFFTTRREQGGTGLGLGIVRALLGAHGGSIALTETDLGGAAFEITLRR